MISDLRRVRKILISIYNWNSVGTEQFCGEGGGRFFLQFSYTCILKKKFFFCFTIHKSSKKEISGQIEE